ncbi:MAG: hypothetical protein JXB06_05870 [Spirochaetales bacterium]|nr:hypothetical protein [Spirochaetales bacterium]
MSAKQRKGASVFGVIAMIAMFVLFCWPGILLFDRPGPLFLGLPPMLWGTYLCVLLCVILMSILVKLGVEK